MANTFVTPRWVTKDTAIGYKNHLKLARLFDRSYNDLWSNKPDGAKIGYTVDVRIEQRWVVNEGQAIQIQPILNQTVPITLNHQLQVAHGWSSADRAIVIEEVQQRYTMPAGRAMANRVDVLAGLEVYKSIYNSIGSPGTAITDDVTYTDGLAALRNIGVPEDLVAVLDPRSQSKLLAANMALFGPRDTLDRNWRSGEFSGPALGIDSWTWDPNIPTHTTGTYTASTPVVNGANQTGSSIITSGWGTGSLKEGDIFTFDGTDGVNNLSYADTGALQQFVVTADVTFSGGAATISISPPIITSGPLQTVMNSPASGAALNVVGATGAVAGTLATQTSRQSLIFNPAAFAFVMADLPENLPGAVSARINDKQVGVSFRYVDQYGIATDQIARRFDCIIGIAPVLPAFAMRVWS